MSEIYIRDARGLQNAIEEVTTKRSNEIIVSGGILPVIYDRFRDRKYKIENLAYDEVKGRHLFKVTLLD